MSDHHPNPVAGTTASNPLKMALIVVVGAAALIVGIVMLSQYAVGTHNLGATVDTANSPAAVAQRIGALTTIATAATPETAPTKAEVAGSKAPALAIVTTTAPATPIPAAMPIPAAAPVKAVAAAANGEGVFKAGCSVCHAAGIAGSPKAGDKGAWAPRIAKGKPTLYEHAIKGFNAMPAKGGNSALADADVKAAVDYMVALVK